MVSPGHFATGYWLFLKQIQAAGGVACEENPDVFFPEDFPDTDVRAVAVAMAKRMCNACPIKKECLTYAIESNQRFGIWAGTLASER
jgi:WhiB family transcriptional regulator, redox-sensing transcriptional regulator